MSETRTDTHRPSSDSLDPQDYQCVACYDLQTPGNQGRSATVDYLERKGYTAADVHPIGQCSHCGAYLRYTALMTHKPTMTYVWIGEQCLGNRFSGLTKAEFTALRKAAALNRERIRKADRIAALVIEHPALACLTDEATASAFGGFMASVGYQLRRDGKLSDRQITAVERIIPESIERDHSLALRMDAERDERGSAPPAPAGRVTVTGTVVHTKWQPHDFGESLKMLVVAVEGYRVWVTAPADLLDERGELAKGTTVRFDAKLMPKTRAYDPRLRGEEDPTFAVGSRPTKASRIEVPSFT